MESPSARSRESKMRTQAAIVLALALMTTQPVSAISYPVSIPFGRSWPLSIVIDSQRGVAYVDASSGEYPPTGFLFGVINLTSHEVVNVLPLNVVSGPMALDQASGDVYIAGNDSVQVFHSGNQSMGRQMGEGLAVVSIAHDGGVSKNIFVTAGNRVYALDPQTGKTVASATVGEGADGMALDPATGRLFVAEYPNSEVFVFDAGNLSSVGAIKLPSCCASQMAIDPRTHILFATTHTNSVYLVNIQTDSFVKGVKVAPSYQNSTNLVAVDSATGKVFVSSSPGGTVFVLDGLGNEVVGGFKASTQVAGLAVNTNTHELYATNYHQVTVFGASEPGALSLLAIVGAVLAVAAVATAVLIRRRNLS